MIQRASVPTKWHCMPRGLHGFLLWSAIEYQSAKLLTALIKRNAVSSQGEMSSSNITLPDQDVHSFWQASL